MIKKEKKKPLFLKLKTLKCDQRFIWEIRKKFTLLIEKVKNEKADHS